MVGSPTGLQHGRAHDVGHLCDGDDIRVPARCASALRVPHLFQESRSTRTLETQGAARCIRKKINYLLQVSVLPFPARYPTRSDPSYTRSDPSYCIPFPPTLPTLILLLTPALLFCFTFSHVTGAFENNVEILKAARVRAALKRGSRRRLLDERTSQRQLRGSTKVVLLTNPDSPLHTWLHNRYRNGCLIVT